mgnify:CR=1 FL=1
MDTNSTRGSTGQLSSTGSTGGGMHHSHSTPAGVDGGARTPPATPKKGGKMLAIRVQMLADAVTIFQVQVIADARLASRAISGAFCRYRAEAAFMAGGPVL